MLDRDGRRHRGRDGPAAVALLVSRTRRSPRAHALQRRRPVAGGGGASRGGTARRGGHHRSRPDRGALRGRDYAREHPELGVDVVIGEEDSTLNGHLLALYLEERVPAAALLRGRRDRGAQRGGVGGGPRDRRPSGPPACTRACWPGRSSSSRATTAPACSRCPTCCSARAGRPSCSPPRTRPPTSRSHGAARDRAPEPRHPLPPLRAERPARRAARGGRRPLGSLRLTHLVVGLVAVPGVGCY